MVYGRMYLYRDKRNGNHYESLFFTKAIVLIFEIIVYNCFIEYNYNETSELEPILLLQYKVKEFDRLNALISRTNYS